ncbi:MAG TPA: hypothetical protein VLS45_00630 [Methylomicrobium sp.]|nr:hypothetical protein [Methylomicrobium sp.]
MASREIKIIPIFEPALRRDRIYRRSYYVDADGQRWDELDRKPFSTDFSFSRFLVPHIEAFGDSLAVFCDGDFLWLDDIFSMINECEDNYAVWCVKHNHLPTAETKMGGLKQTHYYRKNWSSLMVFRPSLCRELDVMSVNTKPGRWLHGFEWADDTNIAGLDPRWNWLWHPCPEPDRLGAVHFTEGTPDMVDLDDQFRYVRLWNAINDELTHDCKIEAVRNWIVGDK